MKNSNVFENGRSQRRHGFSVLSLVMAGVLGVCGAVGSAAVRAQATAGSIYGKAPAGETVSAKGTTNGLHRDIKVDAKGRFTIRALPVGVYAVTLEKDGNAIEKRVDVQVIVGRGTNVDFSCAPDHCGEESASQQ